MSDTPVTLGVARDQLGALVRGAAAGATVHLVSVRTPAGALVSRDAAQAAGLTPVGSWNVDAARRNWADVREAALSGPQAIAETTSAGAVAVLLCAADHRMLIEGPPPLPGTEVHWDGQRLTDETGQPIAPGVYTVEGTAVRIAALDGDAE